MANISSAFGTCYLRAKSKQDILDFIKLQKTSEKFTIEYRTSLYPKLNAEEFINEIEDDFYELEMRIVGSGAWDFNKNMGWFFDTPFSREFEDEELTKLQEKLKEKEFITQFSITDYEGGQGFLSEGEYVTTWKDGKSNFDICSENTVDYTAENCRLFELHDDPYDSEYALKHFDKFMKKVKKEYETTKDENIKDDLKYILDNPEHTKEQLEDLGMSVYWDFEEFIYEFINEYERI